MFHLSGLPPHRQTRYPLNRFRFAQQFLHGQKKIGAVGFLFVVPVPGLDHDLEIVTYIEHSIWLCDRRFGKRDVGGIQSSSPPSGNYGRVRKMREMSKLSVWTYRILLSVVFSFSHLFSKLASFCHCHPWVITFILFLLQILLKPTKPVSH